MAMISSFPSMGTTKEDITAAVNELKTLIEVKFGTDLDADTVNITVNGSITGESVHGAVWDE